MSVPPQKVAPSLLQIDAIVARLAGRSALTEACRFLREEFPSYAWVGIYRRDSEVLVLDAWQGDAPTEHDRIPVGQGLCGKAVREGRSIVVADVTTAPEYLACFPSTRSEIVVPIRSGEEVIGEIDIDATTPGAFDASDQRFLERIAAKLVTPLEKSGRPLTSEAG